jgi:hypothetical protein
MCYAAEAHKTSIRKGNLDIAISQIYEEINQYGSQNGNQLKVFVTGFTSLYSQESDLGKYITDKITDRFLSSLNFNIIERIELDKLLGDMRISLKDINVPEVREEFARQSKADFILFGNIVAGSTDTIRIHAWLLDLHTGNRIGETSKDVEKDNVIRKILGEKIPGKLAIKAHPGKSEIYLDSEPIGTLTTSWLVLQVATGNHAVRIEKSGFESYSKSIYVLEDGFEKIEIMFEKDDFAPLKCGLVSAAVPGLGGLFYGSSKRAKGVERSGAGGLLASSAVIFYIAGFFYAFDEFNKPNFYSSSHQKTYSGWKNAELFTAIGAYALNIVFSFEVGFEYKKRSRTAREVSLAKDKSRFVYSVEPSANEGDLVLFPTNF